MDAYAETPWRHKANAKPVQNLNALKIAGNRYGFEFTALHMNLSTLIQFVRADEADLFVKLHPELSVEDALRKELRLNFITISNEMPVGMVHLITEPDHGGTRYAAKLHV